MRFTMSDVGPSIAASLRPAGSPFAVASAVRTMLVTGAILVTGAVLGHLDSVGIVFLGVACAVAFIQTRAYLTIATALVSQATGAVLGFGIAALVPDTAVAVVVSATVVAAVSGIVGSLSPAAPAFGMMMSIALAFGQFGNSPLSWREQSACYLIGTAVVGAVWLWPLIFGHNGSSEAASVFAAAADLCEAIGGPEADDCRTRLAAASATVRAGRRNARAELAGYAAAALYAEETVVPAAAVAALRAAAESTRSGGRVKIRLDELVPTTPGSIALIDALSDAPRGLPGAATASIAERVASGLRSLQSRDVRNSGARLGVCMGVATAVSVGLHGASHSFWLPLTVAVIMRPEYASIFVRTVNRVCGTIVGAAVATVVLLVVPTGVGVAVGAAVALAFAILMAPKLYGLNVIGVTAAALLAASIGSVDDVLPLVRLLDTALGALIAVTFGYLLWPGSRRFSEGERLQQAIDSAEVYLAAAGKGSSPALQRIRDDAYRSAHLVRRSTERALIEPPPINTAAMQMLPYTVRLERVVDDITRVVAAVDAAGSSGAAVSVTDDIRRIGEEFDKIRNANE